MRCTSGGWRAGDESTLSLALASLAPLLPCLCLPCPYPVPTLCRTPPLCMQTPGPPQHRAVPRQRGEGQQPLHADRVAAAGQHRGPAAHLRPARRDGGAAVHAAAAGGTGVPARLRRGAQRHQGSEPAARGGGAAEAGGLRGSTARGCSPPAQLRPHITSEQRTRRWRWRRDRGCARERLQQQRCHAPAPAAAACAASARVRKAGQPAGPRSVGGRPPPAAAAGHPLATAPGASGVQPPALRWRALPPPRRRHSAGSGSAAGGGAAAALAAGAGLSAAPAPTARLQLSGCESTAPPAAAPAAGDTLRRVSEASPGTGQHGSSSSRGRAVCSGDTAGPERGPAADAPAPAVPARGR